jgi:CcmD family protein
MYTVVAHAQDSLDKEKPQMAGLMRSNGKIYVVVAVLLIILTGLFIYLINLDRKLSRLEKEMITKSDPDQKPKYL